MSSPTQTTERRHTVWPVAVFLLPASLLIGNLAGAWISRHARGFSGLDVLMREADIAMESLDPLGIAKTVRTVMEEAINGR